MSKILLSIKPKYVERILEGTKKVEYRRVIPKCKDITHIIIYATAPICQVVAEVSVTNILSDKPSILWEKTFSIGGISNDEYYTYFINRKVAHAFVIDDIKIYTPYRKLTDYGIKTPPQNFVYIKD